MTSPNTHYINISPDVYKCFTNAWLHHHAVSGSAHAAQELDNRKNRGDTDAGMWYKIYLGHIYEE